MPSLFTGIIYFSKFMFFNWLLCIESSQSLFPSPICYKTSPVVFYYRDFAFNYIYLVLLFLFSTDIILLYVYYDHFSPWSLELVYKDALKILSSILNIWVTLRLVAIDCFFSWWFIFFSFLLFLYISSNFLLYAGHEIWHVIEALDSFIFL